ncbi:MAG: molybdopterin-dependent oxidoreductase [Pseudomonadota bacterium]
MIDRANVTMSVNGAPVSRDLEPRTLLVDFLRDEARTQGVRIACEEGACGACSVLVDGVATKSCLMLAARCDGAEVTTVEGLSEGGQLNKLQEAFISCHALQCGYCTAGMLMSTQALLNQKAGEHISDEDIRTAMSGNYCRCTGYTNIVHAVKVAAGQAEPLAEADQDLPEEASNWIGRPVARREDRRVVSGRGRYADTFTVQSDLHLASLRATRAHARIVKIDTSKASSMPGVVKVVTGAEAAAHWQPIAPSMELLDLKLPRRYPMAVDKVVFYGEPIAFVVAETPTQAEDAMQSIDVEYEDLPVNVDLEKAAAVDADHRGLLYPDWQSNVQVDYAFENGEPDKRFSEADLVIEEEIVSHRFGAMPMETRVVRTDYDPIENRLIIRSSTQVPHQMRMYASQVFNIPETKVQVLADDVGGGFGAKLSVDSEFMPMLATILLGRPVCYFETRAEWIHAGPAARDYKTTVRAGFNRDGRIVAMTTNILADMGCDGAERAAGLGMPLNGGNYAPGPYQLEDYRTQVRCVVTNKAPYNAYRGYGKDLANMMMERVLDQAADQLELDPIQIRKTNLLKSYPHQICTGSIIENGSIEESLDKLAEIMDLPALRAKQAEALEQGKYLGFSLIPYIEPSGATFPGSGFQNYESVTLRIAADGSIHVLTGIQSIGQGIETAYAQVAADILGCKMSDVSVSWGDTTATPFGSGTFSSRGAMFAVGAMVNASEKLIARVKIGAAVLLDGAPENIEISNGIFANSTNGKTCTYKDLAFAAYVQPGAEIILDQADAPILEATGIYRHPQVNWQADDKGRAQFYPAHANGAEGALVSVDPETGLVEVLKVWLVADHGVVLNPLILAGQIKGGVVQQIGGTLYENFSYDKDGVPTVNTMKEYGMPTVWAAPEIEIEHLETVSPSTKIGAKGAGEDGCIATSTALMGAVEDALRPFGVKVMSSQLSPASVREMILAAGTH